MKIYLVVASLAAALLIQAEVQAKMPDLHIELVALDDTTKIHVIEGLFLHTPAGTALHVQAAPMPEAMVRVEYSEPPRYDYRQARRVGRRYERARRYYRRQNRRDNRDLRQDNGRSRAMKNGTRS
ncbi:hypothetical protein MTX78_25130 (plasmid) [Hymenobacter tibetensis]|uniref:Uncharacterized protein n=1 Tax=Hymenobacter tibetensis TaxID=497967 RepID=A0ABY4DC81_9BACT|nr:hypothetical protein [Hymenobacter tibetensis]UOG77693.1 hypothetical protein MTX78_25130 [Hymenobacter tibetensis]